MNQELLQKIGLSDEEITIYQYLLSVKEAAAGEIIKNTGLKRGSVYNILKNLEVKKLVKENTAFKVARFGANHPAEMQTLLDEQIQTVTEQKNALAAILPGLISQYNLAQGKPNIRFYEGIEGIKQIYDDILAAGQNFYFVRSAYEPVYQEKIVPLVEEFVKKRVAKKIKATALTPVDIYPTAAQRKEAKETLDKKRLMDRTWVDAAFYDTPVEINIYGEKIAFISFAKELVGMIIESPQISKAMRQLFILAQTSAKTKGTNPPNSPRPAAADAPARTAPQLPAPSSPPS